MDAAYCVEIGQLHKVCCAVKDCNTYFISESKFMEKLKSDPALKDDLNENTNFLIPTVANPVFACFNVKHCRHAICKPCILNLRKNIVNQPRATRTRAKCKVGLMYA